MFGLEVKSNANSLILFKKVNIPYEYENRQHGEGIKNIFNIYFIHETSLLIVKSEIIISVRGIAYFILCTYIIQ